MEDSGRFIPLECADLKNITCIHGPPETGKVAMFYLQ
jgi:hypothetical protein